MKRTSLFALFLVACLAAGLYLSGERLAAYVEAGLRSGIQERFGYQIDRVEEALRQDEWEPEYVPGQVLIRFKKTVTRERISDFYAEYGLSEKENLDNDPNDADLGLRLAGVTVEVDENLIETLESDPRVAYAEPNYLLQASETPPSDPLFERLWGLHNTGQTGGANDADIDALEAWEISAGSRDIIIAVIDTGIDINHEDLKDNLWTNPRECPQGAGKCKANGVDDDGNGYVDDFHGINAITDSGALFDDFGHGTHVAGIAAAAGDNKVGVVGVSWNARLVGCKFLSAFGSGATSNAVKCFNYIYNLRHKQKQNILITNNSWGGGSPSRSLKEAMGRADSPLHVCSAGNAGSNRKLYPAAYDLENIIAVAATDHDDLYAGFSSWGEDWVDLAAPGVSILSTVPTGGRCPMCAPSGYGSSNGTSMAAPYVAGAAALIWSEFEGLNNAQVKQRILAGVDPLKDQSKKTLTNGRLNLFNAMEKDTTPPAAVTDLSPSGALLTKIILSWTATGDDGFTGTSMSYDVRYAAAPISNATWESAQRAIAPMPAPPGSRETLEVAGLEPDKTYYFALRVADNVGNVSDLSNIVIARTSAGTIVFEDDMESGPGKWSVEDADDSLWHLSSLRFNSPETAWYYGQERKRNYDTGKAHEGTITSSVIDIAGADDALLTFYEWSAVQNNTRLDRTRVQVSADGTTWRTVFESHGTKGRWARREIDLGQSLSESGSIQLRFWFDTIDETSNEHEGWYIDDVQVVTAKLQLPGEKRLLPNLVAQPVNIGFNPAQPHAGQMTTIHGTVINNGNADARAVTVQFVDVSDGETAVPIGKPQTIAEIPVGGSGAAQVQYNTQDKAGERNIRMVLDPTNFIFERNEADNEAVRLLVVSKAPAPNLFMDADNLGFDPVSPQPGAQITIFATVINNGTADASDVVVQFMEGKSRPIALNQVIDTIPAGSSAVARVTYDSSSGAGDPSILVEVDPDNFISELNEADNRASKTLALLADAAPNLELSSGNIGVAPAHPVEGDVVTLYATILNAGDSEAQDVPVQFLDANKKPAAPIAVQQIIPSIAPGSSGVAAIRFDTSNRAGDQKIQVQVDPHNLIAESNEKDNSATAALGVAHGPAPNLVVVADNIGFSDTEPVAGADLTIFAAILNTGSAQAENVVVQFMDVTNAGAVQTIGEQQVVARIEPGASAVASVDYTASSASGLRAIQVVVDPGNFLREVNEEDNEASVSLSVGSAPTPNLFIQSGNIALSPEEPVSGEEATLRAVVGNNGTASAQRISVQFIDITGGESRLLGSEQTIPEIGVGSSGAAAVTITESITNDRPIGTRKIQVLVDASNRIRESNEEDNTATRLLTLRPEPAPNLVVLAENIGFNPAHPRVGDTVTMQAVIRNDGDAVAKDVAVQFEDVSAGRPAPIGATQKLDRIPVGGSGVVTMKFTPPEAAGVYTVRVAADPGNFIAETNEIDNKAARNLEVGAAPLPNLAAHADNIGFNPPNASAGDDMAISLTVLNNGAAAAQNVQVQFTDVTNGRLRPIDEVQTLPSIAAGESAVASVTYNTTGKAGERIIKVSIDGLSIIPESDETDNTASKTVLIAVEAAPNLAVHGANISFTPRNPISGEEIRVRAVVRNEGNEDVGEVDVQFLDTTNEEAVSIGPSQLIAGIPAGSSGIAESVIDSQGASGERKIRVVADRSNLISESNEEDNQAEAAVTISPPAIPNLVIASRNVGFHPSRPVAGDQVTINATVLNDGGGDANEVIVQFVEGSGQGVPISEPQVIDRIAAGSSGVAQVVFDTAGKENPRVQVIVDPNNYIAETEETDNRATASLKMADQPLANLTIQSGNVAFTPKSPRDGQKIIVTAVIVNHGSAPARDVDVQFMDATEKPAVPVSAAQSISLIPVGGSAAVGIVYDTTGKEGKRRLEVVADPGNFIVESSESDNMARKVIEVLERSAPNLIVQPRNVGFNPAAPTEGDRVLIRAVVLNNGAEDASDVVVQFLDVTEAGVAPIGKPHVITFLAAGSSATAPIIYDTLDRPGDRRIRVVVDPNNFIRESDKEDNQTVVTLPVQPAMAPNLAMLSGNIKFDPPSPQLHDRVTVSATVLNNGSDTAHDVIVQILDVSGGDAVPVGAAQLLDAIPAGGGGAVEVTYTDTGETGNRQIRVIVDPNNVIAELNERDNQATRGLVISPPQRPDLAISEDNIEFEPENPVEGQETTIAATITNRGSANAKGFVVRFMDVTTRVPQPIGGPQRIEQLGANDRATVSVSYDTKGKAGERKIRVVADPEDALKELDEENNRAEKGLTVRAASEAAEDAANLVILPSNIRFSPALPQPGDPVTITAVVRNQGKEAAQNVIVRFEDVTEDEATVIGNFTITNTIPPGTRELAVIQYKTDDLEGNRAIRVTADPDDTIPETNESDNRAERTLRFNTSAQGTGAARPAASADAAGGETGAANLALNVQGVAVHVARTEEVDLVVVATTVRNQGARDAGGFAVHVLDVSDNFNQLGSPQTVARLPAGGEATVHTVFRAAGGVGVRTLQVVVDPSNQIAESSERDNRVSVLVTDPNASGQ